MAEQDEIIAIFDADEIVTPLDDLNDKLDNLLEALDESPTEEEVKQQQSVVNDYKVNNSLPDDLESWEDIDLYYKKQISDHVQMTADLLNNQNQLLIEQHEQTIETINNFNDNVVLSAWLIVFVIVVTVSMTNFFKQLTRW